MGLSRTIAAGALLISIVALRATEPAKREFRIPSGRAERTLAVFAQQARVELLFAFDVVQGVGTHAVNGPLAPRDALDLMLAGTPLAIVNDEETGALAVRRALAPPPAARPGQNSISPRAPRRIYRKAPLERKSDAEQTVVTLNPFEVHTSSDAGYVATETLAGSRLSTSLRDVATKVSVMTPEFLQDLAITNLDDAMQYSLNTETRFETADVTNPGGFGIADTTVPNLGSTRMRSLGAPNTGHDFFDTFLPLDAYNTERFTFASGPNSILFGNSQPSGTIDTTFKRALVDRARHEFSLRVDDRGSHRVTADLNQPLVRDRLALRVATLSDRKHDWRAPAFSSQDRFFASLVFKPLQTLSVRAWHESASLFANPARNTLVQDHVTPWRTAGGPVFDNGGGPVTPFPAVASPFARRDLNTPIYVFSPGGPLSPVQAWGNTVATQGFDSTTPAPDNFERSIVDPGLYPFDRTFSGNANQSKINAWIRGAIAEANPLPGLFIEAGFNQERFKHKGADLFNNQVAELKVDANRFLNDRTTPNPHLGRYYFENLTPYTRRNYFEAAQKRLSFSYEIDLGHRARFARWLGRHRLSLLLDRRERIQIWEESSFRVVGDYSFTNDNPNSRIIAFRYYLDPEHPAVHLPFDSLADGIVALPGALDAGGKPVTIAAWAPSTPPASISTTRMCVDSHTLVWHGYLARDRLVVLLGRRQDSVDIQQAPDAEPWWNFEEVAKGRLAWATLRSDSPLTQLKSVVVHPTPWLSLALSGSNSEQIVGSNRRNLDGALAANGAGRGRDYTATLRWGTKLSLQLTRYEDIAVGNLSSMRAATPTPTIGGGRGNNFRREVANLERSAQIYESLDSGDPSGNRFIRSATFSFYQNALAQALPAGQNAGNNVQNIFDLMSDRQSRGWEISLVGNPTPNWRLALSATRSETAETNTGPQYFEFIRERLPVWARYGDRQFLPNIQGATIGQVLDAAVLSFNYVRLSQGRLNTMERRYRLTGTGRYAFSAGLLKGGFIGATVLWRSPATVGYLKKTITDNPFVVPGRIANAIQVDDLDYPIRGGALKSADLFLGYERRTGRGSSAWRVQINVRNLLNRKDLLMQRALHDGAGAIYTVQEPRALILTITVRF